MKNLLFRISAFVLAGLLAITPTTVFASSGSFIGQFDHISQVASTVPANGDVNPYGVAIVANSMGRLVKGDILVSNFNDKANAQGTGTTIVEVSPGGKVTLFAKIDAGDLPGSCPGGVGLTTALTVLREGWVIVGSLPTSDGTSATAKAGCLLVLNSEGHVVETIATSYINGPWDMTSVEGNGFAVLFVTNVLNGTVAASPNVVHKGNVVRIVLQVSMDHAPRVLAHTVIASGFGEKADPNALVIGPTGVALGRNGILYVADTEGNRITAVPNALFRPNSVGTGHTVSSGHALNGPLGLAVAPNGDLLAANSGDGNLVEVTPGGKQVAVKMIDTTGTGGGSLFGLAVAPDGEGVYFVNDGNNTLQFLH